MKTVTHKGKVYQIDMLYSDSESRVGVLYKFDGAQDYPFIIKVLDANGSTTTIPCKVIFELYGIAGTIENAPLELENNAWYMCHWEIQTGSESASHFEEPRKYSAGINRMINVPERALLFKPLYKMVKAS